MNRVIQMRNKVSCYMKRIVLYLCNESESVHVINFLDFGVICYNLFSFLLLDQFRNLDDLKAIPVDHFKNKAERKADEQEMLEKEFERQMEAAGLGLKDVTEEEEAAGL